MTRPALAASLTALASLTACGGGDEAKVAGGSQAPVKFEAACDVEGLTRPLRQTAIVIDEQSVVRAEAAEFRTKNPGLIDSVVAVADPIQAVELGSLAPRERVSLFVTPSDGSAPRLVFTGCAPAVTAEEVAQLTSGASTAKRASDTFFASGKPNEIKTQAEAFQAQLLGAVRRASLSAPDKPGRAAESFEGSSAVRSLKAATRLLDSAAGAPRLVLLAPAALRSIPASADPEASRRAGFEAAKRADLDLGMAEVAVALVGPGASRDYMDAFLLGSRGRLTSWSSAAPTNLAPAPTSVRNFAGTIQYGATDFPVRARIAVDRSGRLTNSWIVVMNEQEAATPLNGSAACDGNGDCKITGDGSGFSQLWSAKAGGEPEFVAELPFSGLRNFELVITRGRATGRVFDPLVDQVGNSKDLRFQMAEVTG